MISQHRKENRTSRPIPGPVKLRETEEIADETVTATLRSALSSLSSLQAHDGHWPSEFSGPLFYLPPLVRTSQTIALIQGKLIQSLFSF